MRRFWLSLLIALLSLPAIAAGDFRPLTDWRAYGSDDHVPSTWTILGGLILTAIAVGVIDRSFAKAAAFARVLAS